MTITHLGTSGAAKRPDMREPRPLMMRLRDRMASVSPVAWLGLVILLVCAVTIGLRGGYKWNDYNRTVETIEDSTATLARSLMQQTKGTFGMAGATLDNVLAGSAQLLRVVGNISDRRLFKHHKLSTSLPPYLGQPIRSRIRGPWVLPFSRRIEPRRVFRRLISLDFTRLPAGRKLGVVGGFRRGGRDVADGLE